MSEPRSAPTIAESLPYLPPKTRQHIEELIPAWPPFAEKYIDNLSNARVESIRIHLFKDLQCVPSVGKSRAKFILSDMALSGLGAWQYYHLPGREQRIACRLGEPNPLPYWFEFLDQLLYKPEMLYEHEPSSIAWHRGSVKYEEKLKAEGNYIAGSSIRTSPIDGKQFDASKMPRPAHIFPRPVIRDLKAWVLEWCELPDVD